MAGDGDRPLWLWESSLVGEAREMCGSSLYTTRLPTCPNSTFESFKGFSQVLRQNPENIVSFARNVVCHGTNESIALFDCQLAPAPSPANEEFLSQAPDTRSIYPTRGEDAPTMTNSFNLIVDSQYVNTPRCCEQSDFEGLAYAPGGIATEWTQRAVARLSNKSSDNGLQYLEARPKDGVCTEESKCPLVIQIPGAGGMAWLLVQASCTACYEQLRTVLVAPLLEEDMIGPDGMNTGSSTQVLITRFIPWVEIYLNNHRDVDQSKVYLVAQSRGDDAALRSVLLRPDLFAFVSLSGKNFVTAETKLLLEDTNRLTQVGASRLEVVHFNIGDYDSCFEDEEYFTSLKHVLSKFSASHMPHVDVRLFLDSRHSVWYAAWNVVHELIWTNTRTVSDFTGNVPLTCRHGD